MRREVEQGANRDRRADHWIYLDRSWAQRLGVTRTAGTYRIRSRELFRRLSRENLGLIARVENYFAGTAPPTPEEVNRAFWGACHGGQQRCAEYLLGRGADLSWIPPWEELTPLDAAQRSDAAELVQWLRGRGARSAMELSR